MSDVIDLVNRRPVNAFCETPSARDMLNVLELTVNLGGIGLIVGAPGVGKTTTLKHFAQSSPDITYCVMSPAHASMAAALRVICLNIGIGVRSETARDLHRDICEFLNRHGDDTLIVDEAQHLDNKTIDELRCIHDETGVPLVLAGNASLQSRFNNRRDASFAAVTSRVCARVDLSAPAKVDVTALAAHYGVAQNVKSIGFLLHLTQGLTGLRLIARTLKSARLAAGDEPITLKHLKDAARTMGALAE